MELWVSHLHKFRINEAAFSQLGAANDVGQTSDEAVASPEPPHPRCGGLFFLKTDVMSSSAPPSKRRGFVLPAHFPFIFTFGNNNHAAFPSFLPPAFI